MLHGPIPGLVVQGGRSMKNTVKGLAILAGALAGTMALPALAQSAGDWVDIKSAKELRSLYSNKTFKGNNWVGHYRADGTGTMSVDGAKPEARTWEIKGNDQVCVTATNVMGTKTRCYTYQQHAKNKSWIQSKLVDGGFSFGFTVQEGLPK